MNQNGFNTIHDKLDDYLDAWLDGELPDGERQAFETHVGECAACRKRLAAAEELQARTDSLAAEVQPARDLWPGIAARLEPRSNKSAGPRRWMQAAAAVAALGLVFVGGMLADRVMQAGDPGDPGAPRMAEVPPANVSAQARRQLPAQYVQLVSDSSVNSQTQDTMLQNLLIVNLAIREVNAALEADPNDPHLRDMLRSLYAQENQILNRVERMASARHGNARTGI